MMSEASQACLLECETASMAAQSGAQGTDAGQEGASSGSQWLERGLSLQLASGAGMLDCPHTSEPERRSCL